MIPAFVTLTSSADLLSSQEIPTEPSTKHLLGAGGINLTACNANAGRCCACQLAALCGSGLVQLAVSTRSLCAGDAALAPLRFEPGSLLSVANS